MKRGKQAGEFTHLGKMCFGIPKCYDATSNRCLQCHDRLACGDKVSRKQHETELLDRHPVIPTAILIRPRRRPIYPVLPVGPGASAMTRTQYPDCYGDVSRFQRDTICRSCICYTDCEYEIIDNRVKQYQADNMKADPAAKPSSPWFKLLPEDLT